MKIRKIRALYFSATGNTGKVVIHLGKHLSEMLQVPFEAMSFAPPVMREIQQDFASDELLIYGTPVYAGRVPNLMLPYLQNKVKGDATLAIPVCVYGNRNVDDALMELRNTLQENGFRCIGGAAIVGAHAFSNTLGRGRPNFSDMSLVTQLASAMTKKIKALDFPPTQPVEVVGQNPIRPYYTPRDRLANPINFSLKMRPVTDMAKCTQCGVCAKLCPMGAIARADVSQVPGKCIKCCGCVKKCPTGAKYFDDEGFLYHKRELEIQYARPAKSEIFI